MDIVQYRSEDKAVWNAFCGRAKNAPFFFSRDFMEYHSERFEDASLLIYEKGELIGLLPANRDRARNQIVSHGGLTFGGLLVDDSMTTSRFLAAFSTMIEHLKAERVGRLLYKAIPFFYHDLPAAEEQYAAFRLAGRLVRRDVGSVLQPAQRPALHARRRRAINRARRSGVAVRESDDFAAFWPVLTAVLAERHGVRPVHSLDEILLLKRRFPENIRLFIAELDRELVSGVVIFESKTVAHAQYIASAPDGREAGALDLLFDTIITTSFGAKRYFSFGISTENEGTQLNQGLIDFKEGFGARACVFDFYDFDLTQIRPVPDAAPVEVARRGRIRACEAAGS